MSSEKEDRVDKSAEHPRSRFAALHTFGIDPDPRFTLANERTFLAWNRTALALVGGGLALTQVLDDIDIPGGNRSIGIPAIFVGALLAFASYNRWYVVERAMRLQKPIPIARIPGVLGLSIGVIAVVSAVLLLIA